MNLYQIITSAQRGKALANLAKRFGISRKEADDVLKAVAPALSTGFMTWAAHPAKVTQLADELRDEVFKNIYSDASTIDNPAVRQKGSAAVLSIFGSENVTKEVARQAAKYTGVPCETIEQMLPVVVALAIGGIPSNSAGLGDDVLGLAGVISRLIYGTPTDAHKTNTKSGRPTPTPGLTYRGVRLQTMADRSTLDSQEIREAVKAAIAKNADVFAPKT